MPLVTPAVAPFEYCLHVPHDPRAVGVARASLRTALTAHELPELIERAELLASEMVTNAIVHAEGEADLRVKWYAERLRMTVWDTSATPPSRREIHMDSECGAGAATTGTTRRQLESLPPERRAMGPRVQGNLVRDQSDAAPGWD